MFYGKNNSKGEFDMTFQQLRYVIKIVETGSISAAAKEMFVSQPSLSKAVMDLEYELGTTIFIREKKGIRLTSSGRKFVAYARQVIDQMGVIENEFKESEEEKKAYSVASQHYNFVVKAFSEVIKKFGGESYEFYLKEMTTSGILEDVSSGQSELGILYLSKYNSDVMKKSIKEAGLEFHHMFRAEPHICVNKNNPLASKEKVTLEDIKEFPRISYEQNVEDSYFFYEELYSSMNSKKSVKVTDKATLVYLLEALDAYTISTKNLSSSLENIGAVTIPLECSEYMDLGYVKMAGRPVSEMGQFLLDSAMESYHDINGQS